MEDLARTDPEIFAVIERERQRQLNKLEMIASENFVSGAVLQAQGSILTHKYAEGYPGRRFYGGCEYVDTAENLALSRVKDSSGRLRQCAAPFRHRRGVYLSVGPAWA